MKDVRLEKITLNMGTGKDQAQLEKGLVVLKNITGITPVKTFSNKRIPDWGVRPGLSIGCKITLRGKKAKELLARLLDAVSNTIKKRQFDDEGNVAFGIPEYIDITGVKYDPKIGVMGLEVCISLERRGFRIKRRAVKRRKIPRRHRITKEESMEYMKKEFGTNIGEEE